MPVYEMSNKKMSKLWGQKNNDELGNFKKVAV